MSTVFALAALPVVFTVAAGLSCPCQLRPTPSGSGEASSSVVASCLDLDLQQVPACVPNNTRLLGFSGNNLGHVGNQTLAGLPSLCNLIAGRSQVGSLSTDTFQHTPKLRLLTLDHNHIHELPPGIFDATPNLQVVDLSNNMLRSLPVGLFGRVRGLKSLDLSHNYLSALPGNLLGGCEPQASLRLSDNLLTALPVQLLHTCSAAFSLDVSVNRMKHMSLDVVTAIANLSDLHTLRLEDNPWHCDCSLKPLSLMLLSHDALERDLACDSPQPVQHLHVVHVVGDLDCAPLPDSFLPAKLSAHTAPTHHKDNAALVALTVVGTVALLLTASFFVVRHYLRKKSAQFNLLNNEDA